MNIPGATIQYEADLNVDQFVRQGQRLLNEIQNLQSQVNQATQQSNRQTQMNLKELFLRWAMMQHALVNMLYTFRAVSSALYGFGVQAGQAAIGFQKMVAMVNTVARYTPGELEEVRQKLLGLANTSARSAEEYARGLYDIVSATGTTGKELKMLEQASKDAVAGFTDITTATKALSIAFNVYGDQVADITQLSDTMFAMVDKAIAPYEDLAKVLGLVVTQAKLAGQSFERAAGLLAFMNRAGISAARSATFINQLLRQIPKRETKLAEVFGIPIRDIEGNFRDVVDIMRDLYEALQKYSPVERMQKLAQVFTDVKERTGVQIVMANFKMFEDVMAGVADSAGESSRAFAEATSYTGYNVEVLVNKLNVLKVTLGTALLQTIAPVVEWLSNWADKLNDTGSRTQNLAFRFYGAAAAVSAFLTAVAAVSWGVVKLGATFSIAKAIIESTTNATLAMRTALLVLRVAMSPWTLAIAAAVGVSGLLYIKIKQMRQEVSQFTEATKSNIQALEKNAVSAYLLIQQMKELQGKTALTVAEKNKLYTIMEKLVEVLPGVNVQLDSQGRIMVNTKDATKAYREELERILVLQKEMALTVAVPAMVGAVERVGKLRGELAQRIPMPIIGGVPRKVTPGYRIVPGSEILSVEGELGGRVRKPGAPVGLLERWSTKKAVEAAQRELEDITKELNKTALVPMPTYLSTLLNSGQILLEAMKKQIQQGRYPSQQQATTLSKILGDIESGFQQWKKTTEEAAKSLDTSKIAKKIEDQAKREAEAHRRAQQIMQQGIDQQQKQEEAAERKTQQGPRARKGVERTAEQQRADLLAALQAQQQYWRNQIELSKEDVGVMKAALTIYEALDQKAANLYQTWKKAGVPLEEQNRVLAFRTDLMKDIEQLSIKTDINAPQNLRERIGLWRAMFEAGSMSLNEFITRLEGARKQVGEIIRSGAIPADMKRQDVFELYNTVSSELKQAKDNIYSVYDSNLRNLQNLVEYGALSAEEALERLLPKLEEVSQRYVQTGEARAIEAALNLQSAAKKLEQDIVEFDVGIWRRRLDTIRDSVEGVEEVSTDTLVAANKNTHTLIQTLAEAQTKAAQTIENIVATTHKEQREPTQAEWSLIRRAQQMWNEAEKIREEAVKFQKRNIREINRLKKESLDRLEDAKRAVASKFTEVISADLDNWRRLFELGWMGKEEYLNKLTQKAAGVLGLTGRGPITDLISLMSPQVAKQIQSEAQQKYLEIIREFREFGETEAKDQINELTSILKKATQVDDKDLRSTLARTLDVLEDFKKRRAQIGEDLKKLEAIPARLLTPEQVRDVQRLKTLGTWFDEQIEGLEDKVKDFNARIAEETAKAARDIFMRGLGGGIEELENLITLRLASPETLKSRLMNRFDLAMRLFREGVLPEGVTRDEVLGEAVKFYNQFGRIAEDQAKNTIKQYQDMYDALPESEQKSARQFVIQARDLLGKFNQFRSEAETTIAQLEQKPAESWKAEDHFLYIFYKAVREGVLGLLERTQKDVRRADETIREEEQRQAEQTKERAYQIKRSYLELSRDLLDAIKEPLPAVPRSFEEYWRWRESEKYFKSFSRTAIEKLAEIARRQAELRKSLPSAAVESREALLGYINEKRIQEILGQTNDIGREQAEMYLALEEQKDDILREHEEQRSDFVRGKLEEYYNFAVNLWEGFAGDVMGGRAVEGFVNLSRRITEALIQRSPVYQDFIRRMALKTEELVPPDEAIRLAMVDAGQTDAQLLYNAMAQGGQVAAQAMANSINQAATQAQQISAQMQPVPVAGRGLLENVPPAEKSGVTTASSPPPEPTKTSNKSARTKLNWMQSVAAATNIYTTAQSATSTAEGLLAGAAQGYLLGGPAGAVVGGIIGLFGARKGQKSAKKQRWDELLRQFMQTPEIPYAAPQFLPFGAIAGGMSPALALHGGYGPLTGGHAVSGVPYSSFFEAQRSVVINNVNYYDFSGNRSQLRPTDWRNVTRSISQERTRNLLNPGIAEYSLGTNGYIVKPE